jgi:hypothetical protein
MGPDAPVGLPCSGRIFGTGEGALVNDDTGGAGPTCRDDSGGGGLPAEENWGPRCNAPDPNAGGPLLARPGVLEGGKI